MLKWQNCKVQIRYSPGAISVESTCGKVQIGYIPRGTQAVSTCGYDNGANCIKFLPLSL